MGNLTFLIPTYNRPDYLRVAIKSICEGFGAGVKIVIGDNGDPVETERLLQREFPDLAIRHLINPPGSTYVENLKFLINACETEWLSILHDDDFFIGNYSSKIMPLLAGENLDFLFSDHLIASNRGEILSAESEQNSIRYRRSEIKEGIVENLPYLVVDQRVCLDGFFIRRDVARRAVFPPGFKVFSDSIWLVDVARLSRAGYFLKESLFAYRLSTQGITGAGIDQEETLRSLLFIRDMVEGNALALKTINRRIQERAIPAVKWFIRHGKILRAIWTLRYLGPAVSDLQGSRIQAARGFGESLF